MKGLTIVLTFASFLLGLSHAEKSGIAKEVFRSSSAQRTEILNLLNYLRATIPASDIQALSWDADLEAMSKELAGKCGSPDAEVTVRGNYDSVSQILTSLPLTTETRDNPSLDAVAKWWLEGNDYKYSLFNEANCKVGANGVSSCRRNYLQLAWASTCAVGCSVAKCGSKSEDNFNVVCSFGPSIRSDEYPWTLGQRCAACQSNCSDLKLCASTCNVATTLTPTVSTSPTSNSPKSSSTFAAVVRSGSEAASTKFSNVVPTPSNNETTSVCTDVDILCLYWATNFQQCADNRDWMNKHCPATCTNCTPKKIRIRCADLTPDCPSFANEGQCVTNAFFMMTKCPAICKFCSSSGDLPYESLPVFPGGNKPLKLKL